MCDGLTPSWRIRRVEETSPKEARSSSVYSAYYPGARIDRIPSHDPYPEWVPTGLGHTTRPEEAQSSAIFHPGQEHYCHPGARIDRVPSYDPYPEWDPAVHDPRSHHAQTLYPPPPASPFSFTSSNPSVRHAAGHGISADVDRDAAGNRRPAEPRAPSPPPHPIIRYSDTPSTPSSIESSLLCPRAGGSPSPWCQQEPYVRPEEQQQRQLPRFVIEKPADHIFAPAPLRGHTASAALRLEGIVARTEGRRPTMAAGPIPERRRYVDAATMTDPAPTKRDTAAAVAAAAARAGPRAPRRARYRVEKAGEDWFVDGRMRAEMVRIERQRVEEQRQQQQCQQRQRQDRDMGSGGRSTGARPTADAGPGAARSAAAESKQQKKKVPWWKIW